NFFYLFRMRYSLFLLTLLLSACNTRKPETPVESLPAPTGVRATIPEIEAEIKRHIEQTAATGDGFFHVSDRGKEYNMKLVRVHTEYLASLGPDQNFACVDLVEESGDVYDVDFFMSGKPGDMKVTENSVHKLNGKPYFAWKQRPDKTWYRLPMKDAGPGLLGVIEGTDEFIFHYRAVLPELTAEGRIWIPIATSDRFQEVERISLSFPGEHRFIKDGQFGNTMLYATVKPEQSGDSINITYKVRRLERGAIEDPGRMSPLDLAPTRTMPVGGRFRDIAQEAIRNRDSDDLMKARALYDHVIDNMRYMKYGQFGKGDANYACDVKTGNCTEFHSLFISLARSIGIPARFAVGASIPSERNEGGIDGYHCWAEFYANGKWWPVDISEANKYTALATYYFGHHPANRIEFSRGRDLMVNPSPASGPINFLAYPLLEVEGKGVAVKSAFSFERDGN
ncbi:MAG: transglutaminase-like domain-containing protein, partial [Bacteroidota bacterium]